MISLNLSTRLQRLLLAVQGAPVLSSVFKLQSRFSADRGDTSAAAIAFYGFLSLFPLLLLALSILGFAMQFRPGLQSKLGTQLAHAVPGFGSLVSSTLSSARRARSVTGIASLLGLLWSGTAVVGAASDASAVVFRRPNRRDLITNKLAQLRTTVTLGAVALLGIGITVLAGSAAFSGAPGVAVRLATFLLAIGLDTALFLLAYRLLTPGSGPPYSALWPGSLAAAVAWNIIKASAGWYVGRSLGHTSVVFGAFASAAGLLAILNLAGRVYVYGAEINAIQIERAAGSPHDARMNHSIASRTVARAHSRRSR